MDSDELFAHLSFACHLSASDSSNGNATALVHVPKNTKGKKKKNKPKSTIEVPTTIPKWKMRTAATHTNHLEELEQLTTEENNHVDTLLLGDSMFQRWKTTGEDIWTPPSSVFNAGIGGDRIENILWRLLANDLEEDGKSNRVGLMSKLNVRQTIFFVGTNNMCTDPITALQSFSDGIRLLIDIIRTTQSRLERIIVMALPSKANADWVEQANAFNRELKLLCEEDVSGMLCYCDGLLGMETTDFEDDVHFNKSGYTKWLPMILSQINM